MCGTGASSSHSVWPEKEAARVRITSTEEVFLKTPFNHSVESFSVHFANIVTFPKLLGVKKTSSKKSISFSDVPNSGLSAGLLRVDHCVPSFELTTVSTTVLVPVSVSSTRVSS